MNEYDLFEKIAKEKLGIETLYKRNRDALDFHDIPVWSIRAALEAAYEAGGAEKEKILKEEIRKLKLEASWAKEKAVEEAERNPGWESITSRSINGKSYA